MGRPPTVSTAEVMQAIALHPEPVVSANDVNDTLGLERASALARLNALCDEGYLERKQVGSSAVVFWMTDKGKQKLEPNLDD